MIRVFASDVGNPLPIPDRAIVSCVRRTVIDYFVSRTGSEALDPDDLAQFLADGHIDKYYQRPDDIEEYTYL